MKNYYTKPEAELLRFVARENLADEIGDDTEPPADESFNFDDMFN